MTTTHQKLAMTGYNYEMMVFSFYGRWCESVTGNSRQYQAVLANSAINAWFLIELAKCEAEFHELADRYVGGNVTALDLKKCYNECTYRMFSIRPKALLDTIKPAGSVILRSKGIPVFSGLNQN